MKEYLPECIIISLFMDISTIDLVSSIKHDSFRPVSNTIEPDNPNSGLITCIYEQSKHTQE